MSYLVKNYMTKDVKTVQLNVTVTKAAEVMATDKNSEGYVIVLDKGKPVGIVTERDIVNNAVAKKLDPLTTKISGIMSKPLITIDPDEDLLQASRKMREKKVGKLVVVRDEIIYGIISVKAIAQHFGNYVDQSIRDILRWSAPLTI